jgi:hypothetical protein
MDMHQQRKSPTRQIWECGSGWIPVFALTLDPRGVPFYRLEQDVLQPARAR